MTNATSTNADCIFPCEKVPGTCRCRVEGGSDLNVLLVILAVGLCIKTIWDMRKKKKKGKV